MDSSTLLCEHSYGGCAIMKHKHLNGISHYIETQWERICVVLHTINDIYIILICIYTPCDLAINSMDYIYDISSIVPLLTKYIPDYIACDGDMNTDFAWQYSTHTKTLPNFLSFI